MGCGNGMCCMGGSEDCWKPTPPRRTGDRGGERNSCCCCWVLARGEEADLALDCLPPARAAMSWMRPKYGLRASWPMRCLPCRCFAIDTIWPRLFLPSLSIVRPPGVFSAVPFQTSRLLPIVLAKSPPAKPPTRRRRSKPVAWSKYVSDLTDRITGQAPLLGAKVPYGIIPDITVDSA